MDTITETPQYRLVGPVERGRIAEMNGAPAAGMCAECGYEDLKLAVVLERITGTERAEIVVGIGCASTLLNWVPARVANAVKKYPTLDKAVLARLSPRIAEVGGGLADIAGHTAAGDCDLCGLPSDKRQVALILLDGGTAAAHHACAARAYRKITGYRISADDMRSYAYIAQQTTSHMSEYLQRRVTA